jgi:hypothetical protein
MKTIHIIQNNKLKFSLFVLGLCFSFSLVNALRTNTGFFMSSQYNKSSFNPSFRPETSYIGMPGLNNIFVDLKTNTLNLDHFIFPASPKSKTFMHPDISYNQFMEGISPNNFLNLDVAYTLASVGFYHGKEFWTIDLGVKGHAEADIPENIFSFIKKGITLGEGQNQMIHNLSGITANACLYAELGLGYSRPILDDDMLIIGAKGKLLLGLGKGNFYLDNLQYVVGRDQWELQSYGSMNIFYPNIEPTYDDEGYFNGFEGFDKISSVVSGFGLGVDLGATFKPGKLSGLNSDFLDKLTVSAAITDLGFISWSGKKATYLATNPQTTIITGHRDISFIPEEGGSLGDIFSEVGDSLKRAINLIEDKTRTEGEITGLRMKMNVGAEYEIIKEKLNVGILSSTYFNHSHTLSEITLAGAYRLLPILEVGISYSILYSKFDTFGLALNFVPKKGINIFLGGDYVIPHVNSNFIPTTTKGLNFQFGITIPI